MPLLELQQQMLTYQWALHIRKPLPEYHCRGLLQALQHGRPLNLRFCPLALIELLGVLTR